MNLKLIKDDGTKRIDEKVYRSIVGCLLYLTSTRPDITFVVNILSRYRQAFLGCKEGAEVCKRNRGAGNLVHEIRNAASN